MTSLTPSPYEKVTRVEVIDWRLPEQLGRVYTVWDDKLKVDIVLQDDLQTLKIFLR